MPFGIKKIPLYCKALSQIHHGGDHKTGSETLFRTQEYYVEDMDMYVDVPLIHGNALRGVWRRIVMNDLAKHLDLGYEDDSKLQVNKDVYHALFSGGTFKEVSEKDSGKIVIEFKRKIRELFPPIALLGTAYGNQPIAGSLQVSHLLPICKELKGYLPEKVSEKYQKRIKHSAAELRDFMFQTRKDELREERKEGEQAMQMLFKYEVLKPGTIFYAEIKLIDSTELELSCLARLLELWTANPRIGGKSSVGLGQLRPIYELNGATSELYLGHLSENKEEMLKFLKNM